MALHREEMLSRGLVALLIGPDLGFALHSTSRGLAPRPPAFQFSDQQCDLEQIT